MHVTLFMWRSYRFVIGKLWLWLKKPFYYSVKIRCYYLDGYAFNMIIPRKNLHTVSELLVTNIYGKMKLSYILLYIHVNTLFIVVSISEIFTHRQRKLLVTSIMQSDKAIPNRKKDIKHMWNRTYGEELYGKMPVVLRFVKSHDVHEFHVSFDSWSHYNNETSQLKELVTDSVTLQHGDFYSFFLFDGSLGFDDESGVVESRDIRSVLLRYYTQMDKRTSVVRCCAVMLPGPRFASLSLSFSHFIFHRLILFHSVILRSLFTTGYIVVLAPTNSHMFSLSLFCLRLGGEPSTRGLWVSRWALWWLLRWLLASLESSRESVPPKGQGTPSGTGSPPSLPLSASFPPSSTSVLPSFFIVQRRQSALYPLRFVP